MSPYKKSAAFVVKEALVQVVDILCLAISAGTTFLFAFKHPVLIALPCAAFALRVVVLIADGFHSFGKRQRMDGLSGTVPPGALVRSLFWGYVALALASLLVAAFMHWK